MTTEELKKRIRSYMSEKRYLHTLSVADESVKLASLFALGSSDAGELQVAAYLHDITKDMPVAEQITLCDKEGTELTCKDLSFPTVLHQKTAGALIKRDFREYYTREIVGMIACHTTGKIDMNLYEKLLFLADVIEETRTNAACIAVRDFFYSGPASERQLDRAVAMSLRGTLDYLKSSGGAIDPVTEKVYEFFTKVIKQ